MNMLDRIVCVNTEGNSLLRLGATYTVTGVTDDEFGRGVFLREVEQWSSRGDAIPFYSWRFQPTHEPVEQSQQHSFVDEREPV